MKKIIVNNDVIFTNCLADIISNDKVLLPLEIEDTLIGLSNKLELFAENLLKISKIVNTQLSNDYYAAAAITTADKIDVITVYFHSTNIWNFFTEPNGANKEERIKTLIEQYKNEFQF